MLLLLPPPLLLLRPASTSEARSLPVRTDPNFPLNEYHIDLHSFSPVVTGANRGIGLGIAECCLENGAQKIYSIDVMPSGEELAAVEKSFPGRIASVIADIRDEDQIQAAVDKIVAAEGALHGMVCNAGITNHKSALDFTKEEIERLFSINVSTSQLRTPLP